MESFRHFPNLDAPTTASWSWTCPLKGQYYAVMYTNCDVPLFDDVTDNFGADGNPIGGSYACESTFTFEVGIGDHH